MYFTNVLGIILGGTKHSHNLNAKINQTRFIGAHAILRYSKKSN